MEKVADGKEQGAADFYRQVANKVKDAGLKQIFGELADEEQKHEALLLGFLQDETLVIQFDEAKDYGVAQLLDNPDPSPEMKPADALALAVKNEEAAMNAYLQLAAASTDAKAKKLFGELAKMESGHKARLETMYGNIAFPEAW